VLNNGRNKNVGYDISPLSRVKLILNLTLLSVETYKKNHTTQLLTSQQKMQISKKNILKMHMK
jgi:hypothetical protein